MSQEQRISRLEANMDIALGRLNAVQAGLLVVSKYIPAGNLQAAASEINQAAEAIHADALATPLPDALVNEMQRVLLELAGVLWVVHSQTEVSPLNPP